MKHNFKDCEVPKHLVKGVELEVINKFPGCDIEIDWTISEDKIYMQITNVLLTPTYEGQTIH